MTDLPDQVRRRLDEVFGDVLPSSTQDDLPEGDEVDGSGDPMDAAEQWLRDNRPPHHDPA